MFSESTIANINKALGGVSLTTIAIVCYWLINNVVWADQYEQDKRTREVSQLQWQKRQIDYEVRKLNLMKQGLVNEQVQEALKEDLKTLRSDISDQIEALRGGH